MTAPILSRVCPFVALAVMVFGPAAPAVAQPEDEHQHMSTVEVLRQEAAAVMPLVENRGTRRLLMSTSWLPFPGTHRLYQSRDRTKAITAAAWEALPEDERVGYTLQELDEQFFYYTRYGSPMAYARALDLACTHMGGGECFTKRRILDFGYGGVGHLRMLASIGAHAVGVDIDPLIHLLYEQAGVTGAVTGVGLTEEEAVDGTLTLLKGRWPGEQDVRAAAGGEYDLILSKNTLKRGYIHPEQEVDPRMLVHLGVDDAAFLAAVVESLKPGGLFVIYNLSPKQREDRYIPWADGRSPFDRGALEAAGLEVIAFDADDNERARAMGRALRWDKQGPRSMDLENDLFALYTIARKVGKAAAPAAETQADKPAAKP
jgi:hypothetical protein